MLISWIPNTLPLPSVALLDALAQAVPQEAAVSAEVPVEPPAPQEDIIVDEHDNFPKGRVTKFFPFQRYGFIQGRSGKEIFFNLSELDFIGQKGRESLKSGSAVGYDVSWTSRGLHVKKMKVY